MEAALWTPKSSNDDSKFVEFLSIHILLTPVWLVFILQYFSSPVAMTVSILVTKLDNCLVVHLLEPAMKKCFKVCYALISCPELPLEFTRIFSIFMHFL